MPKEWDPVDLIKAVEALTPKSTDSEVEGKFLAIQTKIEKSVRIPRALRRIPGKQKGYRHWADVMTQVWRQT